VLKLLHANVLDTQADALLLAIDGQAPGLRTLPTAPLKGGWRLTTPAAYGTMHAAWLGSALQRSGGSLLVCCRDSREYAALVAEHRRLHST